MPMPTARASPRQHQRAIFLLVALGLGLVLLETKQLNAYSVRFGSSGATGSVRTGKAAAAAKVPPPVRADLDKLCPALVQQQAAASKPASSNTTIASRALPPRELLSHTEIREVVDFWYRFQCPPRDDATAALSNVPGAYGLTCKIEGLGQHLLHAAHRADKSLLTVQVGAMDGTSNDPMHQAFVPGHRGYQRYLPAVNKHAEAAARHWLPVLFEPVPSNFAKLAEHYSGLAETLGICSRPVRTAVNFEAGGDGRCAFCRVNTNDDAPETCQKLPDWKKYQMGSLDCDYSKKYFKQNFDLCMLQDPLPCGVLGDLLQEQAGLDARTAPLAILQIDIEGYEYLLLQNYLSDESNAAALPHAIHYEHKVMLHLDRIMPLNGTETRNRITEELLRSKGYTLWLEGGDVLALRL